MNNELIGYVVKTAFYLVELARPFSEKELFELTPFVEHTRLLVGYTQFERTK